MVLFISWVGIILERFLTDLTNDDIEWLNKVDLTFSTLNGFLNALVYGFISVSPFKFMKAKENHDEN